MATTITKIDKLVGQRIRRREDPRLITGRATYVSVTDIEALAAFHLLAKLEGVIPALETAHAVAWIDANAGRWTNDEPVLLCVSGRGDKDVAQVAETRILAV